MFILSDQPYESSIISHTPRLDLVLDFNEHGISRHLGLIADSMYEWEGPVADELGLTPADVATIKAKYSGRLRLQTLVII